MKNIFISLNCVFLLITVLLIHGCTSANTTPQTLNTNDSIKIISANPSDSDTLHVGQTINLEYVVEYTLQTAKAGTITIVAKGEESKIRPYNKIFLAEEGTHKVTLSAEITIPDTKKFNVYIPLTTDKELSTSIRDVYTYNVKN